MEQREQEFLEYVQSGGQVEATDWMPDEYRARLRKFVEMHANSAERATSRAACGGQIEKTTSLRATSTTEPASSSPAASARARVSSLRPSDAQTTRTPCPRRTAPTAAPISPGCSRPTVPRATRLAP